MREFAGEIADRDETETVFNPTHPEPIGTTLAA